MSLQNSYRTIALVQKVARITNRKQKTKDILCQVLYNSNNSSNNKNNSENKTPTPVPTPTKNKSKGKTKN
jgi:hypothetical protein